MMPSLMGEFRMKFHFLTSGSWSIRSLIVLEVAVAVISNKLPLRALNSPEERAIAGRNATLSFPFKPQLTTCGRININTNREQLYITAET